MENLIKEAKKLNIKITGDMTAEDIEKLIREKKEQIKKENDDSSIINSMMNNMMM